VTEGKTAVHGGRPGAVHFIHHKSHMYWLGSEIGLRGEGLDTKPLYHGRARHFKKEAQSRAAMEYSSVAGDQRFKIVIIAL